MMLRHYKVTPSIPIKPLVCMVPSYVHKDDEFYCVMGWAYLHPRSLTIISKQENLGKNMERVTENLLRIFRPFVIEWPYREKMRLHYPFIREYPIGEEGTCQKRGYESIRALSSAYDFRMSCSQYGQVCYYMIGHPIKPDSTLIRELRALNHDIKNTETARARAIAFLYYEQRNVWNPLKRNLDVTIPSQKI